MNKPLAGKVAVVAGATRGAGRGIATALGEAGATVYCTGRSVPGHPGMKDRPETIQETAEIVTARGGRGIPVRVDHTVPGEVDDLFTRVGPFDILVNDIWGGDNLVEWGKKLWETNLEDGLRLIDQAIKTHIITSYYGLPHMVPALRVDARQLRRDRSELAGCREEGPLVHRVGNAAVRRPLCRRARSRPERPRQERTGVRLVGSRRRLWHQRCRRHATPFRPVAAGERARDGCVLEEAGRRLLRLLGTDAVQHARRRRSARTSATPNDGSSFRLLSRLCSNRPRSVTWPDGGMRNQTFRVRPVPSVLRIAGRSNVEVCFDALTIVRHGAF